MSEAWKKQALELMLTTNKSWRQIAKAVGKPKSTVSDYLRQYKNNPELLKDREVEGAKVCFLDLEVSASIVAAFNMYKHFSTPDHIIQFPYILTYACNWLHKEEGDIECFGLDDFEYFDKDPKDDYELIIRLWKWFDEANIVVIHNESFDRGWFTQRCAYHGLPEPSPYRVVCTLKGLKKAMSLPSNSLGYATKYFNLAHNKLHHEGIPLWIACMEGDVEAFSKMKEYNIGDIPTLRDLYLKTRAYIPNHPNMALYFGDKEGKRCSICGSPDLEKLEVSAFTNLSEFPSYRCNNCGTVKRGGQSVTPKETRRDLLRNVQR